MNGNIKRCLPFALLFVSTALLFFITIKNNRQSNARNESETNASSGTNISKEDVVSDVVSNNAGCSFDIAAYDSILTAGDLVFRCGRSLVSHLVLATGSDDESFSHVGIVVGHNTCGQALICHAVPDEPDSLGKKDYVKSEPLNDFLAPDRASKVLFMRVDTSDSIRLAAAASAQRQALEQIAFDSAFDDADTTAFYCTELIAWAYGCQGIDLVEGRKHHSSIVGFKGDYVFPSDIQKSRYLKEIK